MAWLIFTQLQQGVIDGQENPIAVIHAAELNETADLAKEVCEERGAVGFNFATEESARKDLWCTLHEAWETIHRAHAKKQTMIADAAVPISRYPEI